MEGIILKKKTKVIIELSIYVIILIGIILGLFFHFFYLTRTYDAVIERNGAEKEATITLTYNFWDKCWGGLTGTALVETKDGESAVEYCLYDDSASYVHDRYFAYGYVWSDEKCDYFFVHLSFDRELDNITLHSTEDKYFIYSATEDFLFELRGIRAECVGTD